MRDIVCLYHPEFRKSSELRRYGLKHNSIFNVEKLIEESLAALGPYEFVDCAGYDFTDYSDSKTCTVITNSKYRLTKIIQIQNVENKIGSLRVTIYNPCKEGIDFMYIPKKAVQKLMENSGTTGNDYKIKQRIRTTWNSERDDYNRLEQYRVGSFNELARAKG
jgi:hypothetical protein